MTAGSLQCLSIVTDLVRRLHAAPVRYCHWKSNEHLAASLRGETDLDLLVARGDTLVVARVLADAGFKRCRTAPVRRYPAIESHLGLDPGTGRLVHVHLHYQLTVGERFLKGYRLPWEQVMLSTRVLSSPAGLYIAAPELELVVLVLRAALKLRFRDRLRRARLGGDAAREFAWLAERIEPDRLAALAGGLIGQPAALVLESMIEAAGPEWRMLRRLRRLATPPLSEYRTYGAGEARFRRWARELLARSSGRRSLPAGGIVIALVGADGSGKSTVSRALRDWLAPHLDVTTVYFGSGQGPSSGVRRLLERAARLVKRTSRSARASAHAPRGGDRARIRTWGELFWVSALAWERSRRAAAARRARNRGSIVVCDRFPQSRYRGNEGPWLGHWSAHPSRIRRSVARRELAAIQLAERLRPDIVVRLNVTPEVALSRKSDTLPDALERKLEVLRRLQFAPETQVVDIDAGLPLEEVLLEVKRLVWARL